MALSLLLLACGTPPPAATVGAGTAPGAAGAATLTPPRRTPPSTTPRPLLTSTPIATIPGPADTPPLDPVTGLRQCGVERNVHGQGRDAAARDCLWRSYTAGQTARFTTTATTVEGDPITYEVRVLAPDRIEVTIDSADTFGARGRFRHTCTTMAREQSPSSDIAGFRLGNCDGAPGQAFITVTRHLSIP